MPDDITGKGGLMPNRIVLVNKERFIMVLIGGLCLLSLSLLPYFFIGQGPQNPYTKGLKDKIIIIDAGHGGIDPGAQASGIKEKDINIEVVRKLERILVREEIDTFLTRNENSGIMPREIMSLSEQEENLNERKKFAAKKRGSIFLSVHVNSFSNPEASGAIVYYQNKNIHFKDLAENLQRELNKLYTQKWSIKEADFVVINNTDMPSVLVEIGFISNPRDRELISSNTGQEMIAKTIFQGLKDYAEDLGKIQES